METIDLIKERIKRGYYTAALDDLKEILKDDPKNRDAIKLMEAAVKKYVWYAKKYVNKRLDNIDEEIKSIDLYYYTDAAGPTLKDELGHAGTMLTYWTSKYMVKVKVALCLHAFYDTAPKLGDIFALDWSWIKHGSTKKYELVNDYYCTGVEYDIPNSLLILEGTRYASV